MEAVCTVYIYIQRGKKEVSKRPQKSKKVAKDEEIASDSDIERSVDCSTCFCRVLVFTSYTAA